MKSFQLVFATATCWAATLSLLGDPSPEMAKLKNPAIALSLVTSVALVYEEVTGGD